MSSSLYKQLGYSFTLTKQQTAKVNLSSADTNSSLLQTAFGWLVWFVICHLCLCSAKFTTRRSDTKID